jgi:hypothetical protein
MRIEEGEAYYRVTYPDPAMWYPKIETLVFVGTSQSEDGQDVWCFQYIDTYAEFGSVFETRGGDRRVVLATKDELSEMFDIDVLCSALRCASQRRKQKNHEQQP